MARVVGFDPAASGQQPEDVNGNPIPVGVWGDSDSGGGVFGTSGALTSGVSIPIDPPAGVEGHGAVGPGVVGRSLSDNGVVGESQDSEGVLARSVGSSGLLGVTFSPTDDAHGVFGSSTAGGNGVTGFVGEATGVIGNSVRGVGVHGITGGTGNPGVYGQTFGDTDGLPAGPGVWGSSDTGYGVFGSSQTHDAVAGVVFQNGNGVVGEHDANDPFGAGVLGIGGFTTGVRGVTFRDGAGPGVLGQTHGVGAAEGVLGTSDLSAGVRGVGVANDGVAGLTTGGGNGVTGVHFATTPGAGVSGISVLGNGVDGLTFADTRRNPNVAAVRGQSANGFAGLFVGKVRVTGQLSKGGGGFTIDHPKDPENQYLSHSFVESPDMLNVYSGNVTTNKDGTAQVRLPSYFEDLNSDFRYQLTVIGDFAQAVVTTEIKGNAFTIRTDRGRVKVSWQVTGVRRDAWAEANRIAPEQKKPKEERGKYLHPELFGRKAVALHPATDTRFTEVVPDELRDWAGDLPSAVDRGGAGLTKKLATARRILKDRADANRLHFEAEAGKHVEAARRRLQSSAPTGRAQLDHRWRALKRRLEAMR
jgi:hypothetical protein